MVLMDFALKQEANEEIEDILCAVQCVSVCGQYILDATTITSSYVYVYTCFHLLWNLCETEEAIYNCQD